MTNVHLSYSKNLFDNEIVDLKKRKCESPSNIEEIETNKKKYYLRDWNESIGKYLPIAFAQQCQARQ